MRPEIKVGRPLTHFSQILNIQIRFRVYTRNRCLYAFHHYQCKSVHRSQATNGTRIFGVRVCVCSDKVLNVSPFNSKLTSLTLATALTHPLSLNSLHVQRRLCRLINSWFNWRWQSTTFRFRNKSSNATLGNFVNFAMCLTWLMPLTMTNTI